jgi:molecular chaperone HscA
MGKGLHDLDTNEYPYSLLESKDNNKNELLIQTTFGSVSPTRVSADILINLRKKADKYFNQPIDGAVITVPAYFDDGQRQATKDAARIAGINVLRLLNEPTAAALAYGFQYGEKGIYVIFDMGGGTFDVSVLRLTGGIFEVLSTGGDSSLGGDDFDQSIVRFWLDKNNINFDGLTDKELNSLLILARKTKEKVNDCQKDDQTITVFWNNTLGREFSFALDGSTFKSISLQLVNKAIAACKKTLLDSNVDNNSINDVILVGGSTRLKIVRAAVNDLFNRQPRVDINPDEVVAVGAALQADLLSGNRNKKNDWLLLDVLPLSLGIETMGGLVEKIIERNSSIPVAKAQEFTTFKDGQSSMSIHILQGERELVSDCRSLAKFEITGIPPRVAGSARVEVSFQVDADGLLSVTAIEKTTGIKTSINVKPSYGLSEGEVTKMIQDGLANAYKDKDTRSIREAKLELKRNIYAVEEAMTKDGDLLSTEEYEKIQSVMLDAKDLIISSSDNQELIEDIHEKLNSCSDPLVEKRMNKAIGTAIVGKSIDSIEKTTSFKKNNT